MSRLRVAVDGRRLQDRPLTGVGRWLANVVPLVAPHVEVIALTDGRRPPAALDVEQVALGAPRRAPEVVWLQASAGPWLRAFDGVFHGAFNALPFCRGRPAVVSLYDLSWELHPEDFVGGRPWDAAGAAKRRVFASQARWSAARAGAVVTMSDHARQSIVATYGVGADRVVVARPAVDPVFRPGAAERGREIAQRWGVHGRYLVAIGGARRRGLEVAIDAWRQLDEATRPDLVVVGSERPSPAPGIVHAGRVDDSTWAALLAGADALCYPTRFEGYGMPALEAAASGVPVVCARVGPLPEVLGDAAEWCDAPTVPAIAAGLRRVVDSETRRAQLRAAGLERARLAPGWDIAAKVLLGAYERAAS